MNRTRFEQLLANAVRPELHTVVLPVLGELLTMRKPTNTQRFDAVAAAAGEPVRAMVNLLRFAVLDDSGDPLFASYADAASFVNLLADADLAVVMGKTRELEDEQADQDTEGEAGKVF